MPHTVRVKCRIDGSKIIYLNSILDSYEGVGLVRTVDREKGHIVIYSTDTMCKEVLNILEELKKEGMMIEDIATEASEDVDSW